MTGVPAEEILAVLVLLFGIMKLLVKLVTLIDAIGGIMSGGILGKFIGAAFLLPDTRFYELDKRGRVERSRCFCIQGCYLMMFLVEDARRRLCRYEADGPAILFAAIGMLFRATGRL